jgi:sec-independent protein translocase protein TatA
MPGLPFGPLELLLVLGILLLILGPGRLPEMGSAMGRTIREFRKASSELDETVTLAPHKPTPAVPVPPPAGTTEVVVDPPVATPAPDDRSDAPR